MSEGTFLRTVVMVGTTPQTQEEAALRTHYVAFIVAVAASRALVEKLVVKKSSGTF